MAQAGKGSNGWLKDVDHFIALTPEAKTLFSTNGVAAERITVKGNFIHDPGPMTKGGQGGVFAGRLAPEKGAAVLLKAYSTLAGKKLTILGDGPERNALETIAASIPGGEIEFTGQRPLNEVLDQVSKSAFLILPSLWREGCPRVIIEAFALGRPVIASRIGAAEEMIVHERTGLLFEPGCSDQLRSAIVRCTEDKSFCEEMGKQARLTYSKLYEPKANLRKLISIYKQTIHSHKRSGWSNGN